MTSDLQHCYDCGRSFEVADRSHEDEDRCTDCINAVKQEAADSILSSTFEFAFPSPTDEDLTDGR